MPSKYYLRNFVPGYYYHLYNRGAYKNIIFRDTSDYNVFLEIIEYYLKFPTGKPLSYFERAVNKDTFKVRNLEDQVKQSFSIVCFCLMPNHYHLLLKQETKPSTKSSISNFMRRLNITYAMYIVDKYKHSGTLYQGRYKNVLVNNQRQLLYLTQYIHRNPIKLLEKGQNLSFYKYSSYPCYIDKQNIDWLNKKDILNYFDNNFDISSYRNFVKQQDSGKLSENVAID